MTRITDHYLSIELDPDNAPGEFSFFGPFEEAPGEFTQTVDVAGGVDLDAFERPSDAKLAAMPREQLERLRAGSFDMTFNANPVSLVRRCVAALGVPPRILFSSFRAAASYEDALARQRALAPPAGEGGVAERDAARGERQREYEEGMTNLSGAIRGSMASFDEMAETLEALSQASVWLHNYRCVTVIPSSRRSITPEAKRRAEAHLFSLLTTGERECLEQLDFVPVIGRATGDLILLKRDNAFNLLRFFDSALGDIIPENLIAGGFISRGYCVSSDTRAPADDVVASILLCLRSDQEVEQVWMRAQRVNKEFYFPEGIDKRYALLRALAECRCAGMRSSCGAP